MDQTNYQCNITANVTTREAFEAISNGVSEWWTQKFEGSAKNLDDVFIVRFGGAEITVRTVGFVPSRKIFWRVIDSSFPSLKDKIAWTDTKIVWEILPGNRSTQIRMTHIGLIPEKECYTDSAKQWDWALKEKLVKLLNKPHTPKYAAKLSIPVIGEPSFLLADISDDEYTLVKAS